MGLFGRKKKKDTAFFGARITPSCAYCLHGADVADSTKCLINQMPTDGSCKRFAYDPLKRQPHGDPILPAHDPEEFKL